MTRPRLFRKRSRATSTSMGVSSGQRPVQTDQLAALMIPVIAIVGHTSRVLPAGAEAGGIAHQRVQLLCDMFGVGRIKDDTQGMGALDQFLQAAPQLVTPLVENNRRLRRQR